MSILDKLKGRPPSAEKLRAQLQGAVEVRRQSESVYREACLAAADGGASEQKARTEAAKTLDSAKRTVRELHSAVKAAGEYEAQAAEKAAVDDRARRWATVREHVATREKASKDAEAAIAKLADAMDRIAEANTGILNTAPQRPDPAGALLGGFDLEAALRMHLLKAGFAWASKWPWGADSIPTFGNRMAEADAYVCRIADEGEKGSAKSDEAAA